MGSVSGRHIDIADIEEAERLLLSESHAWLQDWNTVDHVLLVVGVDRQEFQLGDIDLLIFAEDQVETTEAWINRRLLLDHSLTLQWLTSLLGKFVYRSANLISCLEKKRASLLRCLPSLLRESIEEHRAVRQEAQR